MRRIFTNGEQIEGLAGILDNLAVVAIASWVVPFFGFGSENMTPWLIFLLSLTALGCAYGGFCLRKLVSYSDARGDGSLGPVSQPSSPQLSSLPSSSSQTTMPPPELKSRPTVPIEPKSGSGGLEQPRTEGKQEIQRGKSDRD